MLNIVNHWVLGWFVIQRYCSNSWQIQTTVNELNICCFCHPPAIHLSSRHHLWMPPENHSSPSLSPVLWVGWNSPKMYAPLAFINGASQSQKHDWFRRDLCQECWERHRHSFPMDLNPGRCKTGSSGAILQPGWRSLSEKGACQGESRA